MSACSPPQRGFALLASMLVLAMLASFSVGMIYIVQSEARLSSTDLESTQAYYGAAAAMEKMVVDLNGLLATQAVPTASSIEALGGSSYQPSIPGVTYTEYSVTVPNTSGILNLDSRHISEGPSYGLLADVAPVTLKVSAKGTTAEVVEMTRETDIAWIPVFQFGVFSEGDLSYFSNGLVEMGGRVHTNGNLFLAAGSTQDLVVQTRVSAAEEVIRAELANGLSTSGEGWTRPAKIPIAPNGCQGTQPACRDLLLNEGSRVGGPSSSGNEAWTNLSQTVYSGMILNEATGAKGLSLEFVNTGVRPIELIRRPPTGEDPNSLLGQSRLYNQAQIRILISDNVADLPGGVGVRLANVAPYMILSIYYGGTDTAFAETSASVSLVDGFILVQGRQADSSYADVTLEWLNLGIARENSDAILRFQALHDHEPNGSTDHTNDATNRRTPDHFYPFSLYDAREGELRENSTAITTCALGGIMNIVELDVGNLRRWLTGLIGSTGTSVENTSQNGYLLYFSDRRGMLPQPPGTVLVGEYGYEDVINPASSAGTPNATLDVAEDVNQNATLDTYGAGNLGTGFGAANGDPTLRIPCIDGWEERVSGARHALKLVNGALIDATSTNMPLPGFTVGSENPVYVQGDYNANSTLGFGNPHAAAAIIADAVTFLSNNWADWRSITAPRTASSRPATTTWYRVAVAAGKNLVWPHPSWDTGGHDYGLDGGTHNFLRTLESWSGQTFYYRGSLVSLFHSEYATGIYKCCGMVYSAPSRDYAFDTDFLNPVILPPATPRLKDVVTQGFRQVFTSP